jgi:cobalt/nickel transport system permease protein
MHMADALVSPVVGGAMWAGAAGLIAHSARKVRLDNDEQRIPLMGVAAAFVFAAQMINFTIPATGSSGHLGGGLILGILLGPYAAFLAMASILTVQALLFADGGLLALGCNMINLGLFSCFIAYPLIYRPIVGKEVTPTRLVVGSLVAAIVGLQLGAFGVVLETLASGITELPFGKFVLLMQPIHLAIGLVEGLATSAVVLFVWRTRPEILDAARAAQASRFSLGKLALTLAMATVLIGGGLSWFASTRPDGLEWSMAKTSGKEELEEPPHSLHHALAALQKKIALLPDYGFTKSSDEPQADEEPSWPAVDAGTTFSGLIGSAVTLLLAGLIFLALKRRRASAQ